MRLDARNPNDIAILKEYADFWKMPEDKGSQTARNRVAFVSGSIRGLDLKNGCVIISPRGIENATEIAEQFGAKLSVQNSTVHLKASPNTTLSLNGRQFQFSSNNMEELVRDGPNVLLYKIRQSEIYVLALDLVGEYHRFFYDRMDETPNWRFRLLTRLPLSYGIVPSFIRNRVFKAKGVSSPRDEDLSPVEFLRSLFLASLAIAVEHPIPIIGFWPRGKTYALAVTHDVETQLGLEDGAARLIQAESSMGIRSTWNIPSERYPLSSQLLIALAKEGEVGCHDTKHDGRLLFTRGEEKEERVACCRERLEALSRSNVRGFRAPLLQHSRDLLTALRAANFEYDSSMPSWEALSPTSLRAHGVGTVFPFLTSGLVEIPVSMPQDHQLIRVGGLSVGEAVNQLIEVSQRIKKVGGACVLLVHPDYEFANEEGLDEYRRLLGTFESDPECEVMTLGEMAKWWKHRQDSSIDEDGTIISPSAGNYAEKELDVMLVTGYGADGFRIESSSHASTVELSKNSTGWS